MFLWRNFQAIVFYDEELKHSSLQERIPSALLPEFTESQYNKLLIAHKCMGKAGQCKENLGENTIFFIIFLRINILNHFFLRYRWIAGILYIILLPATSHAWGFVSWQVIICSAFFPLSLSPTFHHESFNSVIMSQVHSVLHDTPPKWADVPKHISLL